MFGLTVFGAGFGPDRFENLSSLAADAEAAGFDSVWTGELYNRSATIPMATLAMATSRAGIGSNIAYGVGRTPLVWAAEARDLDELSAGRLILGLGNGTSSMMENWHGVSGDAPAARMEELVEVLRKLWRLHEGPVHHDGRFYKIHLQPTADTPPPYRERLPIWSAGVNFRMIEVAGRVSDGLVCHPMFTSKYLNEFARPALEAGAAAFGRKPSDITTLGIVICSVDADEETARRRVAFAIGQYAASHVYDRLFSLHGWSESQSQIRDAARRGDTDAMVAAVPDEAIDLIGIACTPGGLADRAVAKAKDFGYLNLVVPPWGLSAEEAERDTRLLLDEMRPVLTPEDRAGVVGNERLKEIHR